MKRFSLVPAGCLALAVALSAAPAIAGYMQIRIDAGNNPSPAAGWNKLRGGSGNMGVPVALLDTTGAATEVTATLAAIYQWSETGNGKPGKYAGTILGAGSGYGLYIHHPPGEPDPPWWGTLTLDGLAPESWQWYRVAMSASAASDKYPRQQNVSLNGSWPDGPDHNGQDFNAYTDGFDAGKVLSWDHVLPDANGLITLTVTRGDGDAYLNALVITLVPEPATALLLVIGGLSLAMRRRRRRHCGSEM